MQSLDQLFEKPVNVWDMYVLKSVRQMNFN